MAERKTLTCDSCEIELNVEEARLVVSHNLQKEVRLDPKKHGTDRGIMSESVALLDFCSYGCAAKYFEAFGDRKLLLEHDDD